jgi:hypothetical protein
MNIYIFKMNDRFDKLPIELKKIIFLDTTNLGLLTIDVYLVCRAWKASLSEEILLDSFINNDQAAKLMERASEHGKTEIVRTLLARVPRQTFVPPMNNLCVAGMRQACDNCHVDIIRQLLPLQLEETRNTWFLHSLLVQAIHNGHTQVFQILMDEGLVSANLDSDDALQTAAASGRYILRQL